MAEAGGEQGASGGDGTHRSSRQDEGSVVECLRTHDPALVSLASGLVLRVMLLPVAVMAVMAVDGRVVTSLVHQAESESDRDAECECECLSRVAAAGRTRRLAAPTTDPQCTAMPAPALLRDSAASRVRMSQRDGE